MVLSKDALDHYLSLQFYILQPCQDTFDERMEGMPGILWEVGIVHRGIVVWGMEGIHHNPFCRNYYQ
jgi:hypothetical protein